MRKWESIRDKAIPVLFIALVIMIWQLIVDSGMIARYILPSPWDVITVGIAILPEITVHIYTTLQEAITGFLRWSKKHYNLYWSSLKPSPLWY